MPEIKETFELLKNYVDKLPLGLLLFDGNKKLLSWNNYITIVLELKDEELKKGNLGLLSSQLEEIINSAVVSEKELIGLHKPLKVKKINLDDGNIILIITESHQEALGEMSHELRRPITNIKTLTESLLLGAKNDPDISQKFLEQINQEVDRLTKLISELINLSKIRSGKLSQNKQKINLKSKIGEAIQFLGAVIDKNKSTVINDVSDTYEILADPDQIEHVIQNLLENAIKYSKEGSMVTIKAGPVKGSFQIDDTGIGISELKIPKIFDRFYRVDRTKSKGSSGLGLSIVKNVIDLHGGRIEVKSTPGSGSSFIIYLPIS